MRLCCVGCEWAINFVKTKIQCELAPSCVLTDAQGQVQQSHANIQSEEQDHIGHFTEEDDVPHMLLNCYCITEGKRMSQRGKWVSKGQKEHTFMGVIRHEDTEV